MLGHYGDIIFETSDSRILNFSGFKREIQSRWGKHDVIGRKPISEFIGPDLDTISFTIHLNGSLGVKPVDEMNRWLEKARLGHAEILTVGNRVLGVDKWTVQRVSQMWDVIFNKGEVYSGKVEVSLEEYLEELE